MKRWRGLSKLVVEAVERGSALVESVHRETAARTFALLEQVPGLEAPARIARDLNSAALTTGYGGVRIVSRALGQAVELALDVLEATDGALARSAEDQLRLLPGGSLPATSPAQGDVEPARGERKTARLRPVKT